MTMLADHPTWPEKKTELDKEPRLEKEPSVAPGSPGWALQPQGKCVGIPTPPPFPPPPTNQGTQAQQALVAKPCPFCGGPMTCQYNVAAQPAQLEIGCHDTRCLGPKLQCLPGNMATAIQLWNLRSP